MTTLGAFGRSSLGDFLRSPLGARQTSKGFGTCDGLLLTGEDLVLPPPVWPEVSTFDIVTLKGNKTKSKYFQLSDDKKSIIPFGGPFFPPQTYATLQMDWEFSAYGPGDWPFQSFFWNFGVSVPFGTVYRSQIHFNPDGSGSGSFQQIIYTVDLLIRLNASNLGTSPDFPSTQTAKLKNIKIAVFTCQGT